LPFGHADLRVTQVWRHSGDKVNTRYAILVIELPAADVTGLVSALSGKSGVGHGHAASEITGRPIAVAMFPAGAGNSTRHSHDPGS